MIAIALAISSHRILSFFSTIFSPDSYKVKNNLIIKVKLLKLTNKVLKAKNTSI